MELEEVEYRSGLKGKLEIKRGALRGPVMMVCCMLNMNNSTFCLRGRYTHSEL